MKYLFSLGSNLFDRISYLSQAVNKLSFLKELKVSSVYETKAMLLRGYDPEWDKDFLNLCLSGFSDMDPFHMLGVCKQIETNLGRDLAAPRWSPRVIDIDILLAGDYIINDNKINVPHRGMLEREFVLVPACEIEANLIHPITNKPLQYALKKLHLNQISKVKKTKLELING
ncbi:2-amino-4-hydroxy-6-hydroxymethyldihydropteridine diphosphokinase [Holosporaceae bacterium 'Namur']|nr:2-amino-4-hydroxy-6-hydroxymethyldihydropteridine diphosphokinase [Holosporaceae bacterium 'Namur']